MDDKKLHRCFTFSEEQLKHLRSKKYKIDRMECFMSLVDLAEPVPKLVQISKTKQVEILAGQVMVDNTQLAKLWDKDRKTVPKLLDAMEAVAFSLLRKWKITASTPFIVSQAGMLMPSSCRMPLP